MKSEMISRMVFVIGMCASLASADAMEVSKYAKVYVGPEGLSVTVLPIATSGTQRALIRVSGVDSELDGLVIAYEKSERGRDQMSWVTTLHGEKFSTIYTVSSWGQIRHKARLPESPMAAVDVYYDEKASKAVNTERMAKLYEAHREKVKALASWNRKERQSQEEQSLLSQLADLNKSCGTAITATIDWATVTDEHLKDLSIHGYCAKPLDALETICRRDAGTKTEITNRIGKLHCQFGSKMRIRLTDDTITWKTSEDASNQQDFAENYFRNEL
jgi:hypothetical protein